MDTDDLLNELSRRKIQIEPHRGRLLAIGSTSKLTKELKAMLAAQRLEVMARIGARQTPTLSLHDQLLVAIRRSVLAADLDSVMVDIKTASENGLLGDIEANLLAQEARRKGKLPDQITDIDPREWADSGSKWEVESVVLGETVLWAADNALACNSDMVLYRARELVQLAEVEPEAQRKIHLLKKAMDGELL